ncbi:MAG: glycoside hydrolase family 9 protein [Clostridiales bacterium]|jgi:hypothetical protein|nr:glycoside hydrolase family 9 protein [Clostridiales bacterium]
MKILTSHLPYDVSGFKRALFLGDNPTSFSVFDQNGNACFTGSPRFLGHPDDWGMPDCWELDFTPLSEPGTYEIRLDSKPLSSIELADQTQTIRLLNALTSYFKGQRSSGECLKADHSLKFSPSRPGTIDAHGGWRDATGDYGIHLSQLSFTSLFNTQQSSICGWLIFRSAELLEHSPNLITTMLLERMRDEAIVGADFLMRMRAPSGSFFRSIDRGSLNESPLQGRRIDAEPFEKDQPPETMQDANYEVGFRSGGGAAIATLAAASRWPEAGAFTQKEYLNAAFLAFNHLISENSRHVNDQTWNILDWQCALLGAVEIYKASNDPSILEKARSLAKSLLSLMTAVNPYPGRWFESPGSLFFHPSDEGLPIIALLEYASIETDPALKEISVSAAADAMRYLISLSQSAPNPFGYPRFLKSPDEPRFFFPHDTVAAPWWQGENARLASLASAARLTSKFSAFLSPDFIAQLKVFGQNQRNWIFGLNHFDSCMMEGYGRNNIQYFYKNRYDFTNCPGGICNGITAGLSGNGIEFITKPTAEVDDNWRWAEQWLPHAGWMMLYLALDCSLQTDSWTREHE